MPKAKLLAREQPQDQAEPAESATGYDRERNVKRRRTEQVHGSRDVAEGATSSARTTPAGASAGGNMPSSSSQPQQQRPRLVRLSASTGSEFDASANPDGDASAPVHKAARSRGSGSRRRSGEVSKMLADWQEDAAGRSDATKWQPKRLESELRRSRSRSKKESYKATWKGNRSSAS